MELVTRLSTNRRGLLHIGAVPYKTIHLETVCHRLRMSARKFKMHVNMSAFFYYMRHYYGP